MTRQDKYTMTLLIIVCGIAAALGFLNKSYLVSGMYIGTLLCFYYYKRNEDFYDIFYLILIVSTIFDYVLYVPGIENIYMFHIVLGAFTLYTLYKLYKDRTILMKIDKKVITIMIVWFLYICASIFWAESKVLAIKFTAIYILMFSFIFNLIVYNINKARLVKTIKILGGLISLIIVIGFLESIIGKQLPVVHHYDGIILKNTYDHNALRSRPIAFSFNPNNLAATIGIMLPICLFSINKVKTIFVKGLLLIVSSISFAVIILSTSRTGFVSMFCGFAIYIIYCICTVKSNGIKSLIYPMILICTFTLSYNHAYKLLNVHSIDDNERVEAGNDMANKMNQLMEQNVEIGGGGSVNVRMTIIKNVLEDVINNKNIKGNGVGNVQYFIKEKNNTDGIYSPHCYPIEILCEFGVFGVLIYGVYYLYLLIGNLIYGFKKKNVWCFMAVSSLIAFIPASFGPSSITYVFSYWILMALSIACIQIARNE